MAIINEIHDLRKNLQKAIAVYIESRHQSTNSLILWTGHYSFYFNASWSVLSRAIFIQLSFTFKKNENLQVRSQNYLRAVSKSRL